MRDNDINLTGFIQSIKPYDATHNIDAPISIGYARFMDILRDVKLSITRGRNTYTVPTDCPANRYTTPTGLGQTMGVNSVVLMYLHINQYLLDADARRPTMEDRGFLCVSCSSSSAALKGIVRYCASGTVCRCYNMRVGMSMLALAQIMEDRYSEDSDLNVVTL